MISTGFEQRVKIQQIIDNQLPEFILDENPKFSEFLKQYYISQEYPGGPVDIAENLDQYLKFDNLTPEVIAGNIGLSTNITSTVGIITVTNTKGFPPQYGLLKIGDEIITYTGITTNTFTGCIRGFCGIVDYHQPNDPEELKFSTSKASSHDAYSPVTNLSSLFLKEFYKKLKYSFAPGFDGVEFYPTLKVDNFLKRVKDFYAAKGTNESFEILFNVLYNVNSKILNTEDFLLKPSESEYIRREVLIAELITPEANPYNLVGEEIRSNDESASGPVSKVDIITRNGKVLYKIELFSGYDDNNLVFGKFAITPKTKVSDSISIGSSVITVDSTVGFDVSGSFICNNKVITYSDKSINQFYGCTNVLQNILAGSDIRSEKVIYGYENGDSTKKIELTVQASLSNLENIDDLNYTNPNDNILFENFGDNILNYKNSFKEILFNSWIYNVRSRYEISKYSNDSVEITLYEIPDKSSLKVNDRVDIFKQDSTDIVLENVSITSIDGNKVFLDTKITEVISGQKLSIIRRYDYASTSGNSIELKYPNILSNVQNTYNENEEYIYVASNSLPSNTIVKSIKIISRNINSLEQIDNFITEQNNQTFKYSVLVFEDDVPFITGDSVIYTHTSNEPIIGLTNNTEYFVEVLSNKTKIRLYSSRSFIVTGEFIEIDKIYNLGNHKFTLSSEFGKILAPKKSLSKFPIEQNFNFNNNTATKPGSVGTLINGVDITNYKSNDNIFYGPLKNLRVINSGLDYDVINPPKIIISNSSVGLGTTALANVVVSGSVKNVVIDPQKISIKRIISSKISGGNGSGAILEPVLLSQYREIEFNALQSTDGGGVNIDNETIVFSDFHKLKDGQKIVYNSNGNLPLGIGTFNFSNTPQGKYLENGSVYYPKILNTRAIRLHYSESDLNSGINTIGFTQENTGGIHKFREYDEIKVLSKLNVLDGGSGYTNRSLYVKSSGISTISNMINYVNHGFNDGEIINYSYESENPISGLSTSKQYYILKNTNNSFQLSDAGDISVGVSKTDYIRRKPVKFESNPTGYHIFSYPKISVDLEVEYSGFIGTITATPIVRGEIIDAYLYESGTNYGSNVLNFHKKPTITIKNGSGAQLKPIIINGRIVAVEIQTGGSFYPSSINLDIFGSGLGAELRPNIVKGRINSIVVINSGIGYDENTQIKVSVPGKNLKLDVSVRELTINNMQRFSDQILTDYEGDLAYSVCGYLPEREGILFDDPDTNTGHSKIIGWCRDGNPIYGPYGYSNPKDFNSEIIKLQSGYSLSVNNVYNRPPIFNFSEGFFVEDYIFEDSGQLDISNGRFEKTPEFPQGVYAYHVGVKIDPTSGNFIPEFPYFVGEFYRSNIEDNFYMDQNNDFNDSVMVRNTFPYRVNNDHSANDFLPKVNKKLRQITKIKSIKSGKIDSINIIEPGEDYSVGDSISFDNTETGGGGCYAEISKIYGKEINKIETSFEDYQNTIFTWKNNNTISAHISPYHNLLDGDIVQIAGISTNIFGLSNNHKISVDQLNIRLSEEMGSSGIVTDIYVTNIPDIVSIGSSIIIEDEICSVLNIFNEQNVIRIDRGSVGTSHTSSTIVEVYSNYFDINLHVDYFDSTLKDIVYFNPTISIGVGVDTGSSINREYYIGDYKKNISIPTQSIYLPNHPFKTNQRVLFSGSAGGSTIDVSNISGPSQFSLGIGTHVYIINKSKDFIGIVTQVGLTTQSNGLFFITSGNNKYNYNFSSIPNQISGSVKKIDARITTSEDHNLSDSDHINLTIKPNLSVGIGTSTHVRVKYNQKYNKLLINPIGFNSSSVNVSSNIITLPSHNFKTGQKIFYSATGTKISGLTTSEYYVYRSNTNNIQLCETYLDSISNPPTIISIGSSGGNNQEISQINPRILSIKNNNLVFNLSDSSLSEYKFEFFYDKQFNKNFISVANTSNFTVTNKTNNIGIVTESTINFSENLPNNLYYNLSKNGIVVFNNDIDNDADYQISFVDELYNQEYKISGIGSTTFHISLYDIPQKLSYTQNECSYLKYETTSKSAKGGISNIKILNSGYGYKKLPKILEIVSRSLGKNSIVELNSKSIGKIGKIEIDNDGYDYPSDKSLRPHAQIDTIAFINNNEKIENIKVLNGGKNIISKPELHLVNSVSRKKVLSGIFEVQLGRNNISHVNIIQKPTGLESVNHEIFSINNSNGISIEEIRSVINGIVECVLRTPPITGYIVPPFKSGDLIFVEGIAKPSSTDEFGVVTYPGDGFNSIDHGYNFFEVVEFINSDPAILKYDISKYTLTPAKTPFSAFFPSEFTAITNIKNYPTFELTQMIDNFIDGENIIINNNVTNALVKKSRINSLNIFDPQNLLKNYDTIRGSSSGAVAKISRIFKYNNVRYSIDSTNKKELGWKTDIGKLNTDLQVTSDNDYYQTLAYSVQSPIEYKNFVGYVNNLVHPIGTKNFADVGITSVARSSIGSSETLLTTLDFVQEKRIDTIDNFDLVTDYDVIGNSSTLIRFKNKRLSNYIACLSNRVLQIDDISNSFSSSEFNKDLFLDAYEYPLTDFYSKFLIQICDTEQENYQLSEIVIINDYNTTYTMNKLDLYNNESLGSFSGEIGPVGDPVLRFNPSDPYNKGYNLKIYRESFDPDTKNIGIGFTDYGFIRLSGKTEKLNPGVGISTTMFRGLLNQFDTIFSSSIIIDTDNNKLNYYEVIGYHDGVNSNIAEFYFDSEKSVSGLSGSYIGTFGLNISNGILNLSFTSNKNNNVLVKTKTVGFGTTASGIGTYRYLVDGQTPGTERTTRLESDYRIITGITTIKTFDSSIDSSLKSLIRVGIGSTVALHQVSIIADQVRNNIQHYPFISIGSTSGIGTFSTEVQGLNVSVKFHPDNQFENSKILVQSFDQFIYSDLDEFNIPDELIYGTSKEKFSINRYGSINNFGKDRLNFDLNYDRTPIFQKTFNPTNLSTLNKATGTFTINNHFFQNNEELIYTPGSTLSGIVPSSVGIGTTIVGGNSINGDFIVGFSTITGIEYSTGILVGNKILGTGIPNNTEIVSIGQTYSYFIGNVSSGSSTITGIANTAILSVGAGIFSGNNNSLGTIISVGINSITASAPIAAGGSNRIYYANTLKSSLTLSNVSVASTFREIYTVGILTNICPSKVYAIKIDENNFQLKGVSGPSGIGFTFTSSGSGNYHKLEMKKKNEKSLITINGVNQYPLTYTSLVGILTGNIGNVVSVGASFIRVSGISSIMANDIIKIEDEYMTISNVGFGTTAVGPITGIGSIPIIKVERGRLGSTEVSHYDGSNFRIYKGSYNIIGNQIWFADAPDGKANNDRLLSTYLLSPKSTFNGRIYLRKDYTNNQIYDDISTDFTGIGRTFTLYKEGNVVSNAASGNNLLFINDVFQTPDTENNNGNNYEILNSGISSVSFSATKGLLPNPNEILIYENDVNQNLVPRGGLIVSLASTGGIGYAPLVGVSSAMLDVRIGVGGSISYIGFTSSIVVGIATTGIIGMATDRITGITTRNVRVNQKITDILSTQRSGDIIPNITKILPFDTRVSSIGIGTVFLNKVSTNASSITTSFGFDIGPIHGSGYNKSTISIGITDSNHTGSKAIITATVGAGGSIISFNINNGGTGYTNPLISISDPSYENLPIQPISRIGTNNPNALGIGLSISVSIGPNSKNVGIGTSYFAITSFEIKKPGYGFELGDTFSLVGLVTDSRLSSPIEKLIFTINDIKTDSFASWQLGEFDFIDSTKDLQNSVRKRFPLYKNGSLLSFEKNIRDTESQKIDFDALLLIYINGVMQEPKISYQFTGGTSFTFTEAPKYEDNIAVFFYRGTAGVDSGEINIIPSIKPGDTVQIKKNPQIISTVSQNPRVASYIVSSDTLETGIYLEEGIDEINFKPLSWTKQKTDLIINDVIEYKERNSLESLIFPTAKIIKSIDSSSTDIFVDNAQFFNYEENSGGGTINEFGALIILGNEPTFAEIIANVSVGETTISDLTINNGGSGYNYVGAGSSVQLKFRSIVGSGGSDAIIYAPISDEGAITTPFDIISPGYGYTSSNVPEVIAPIPNPNKELISSIAYVQGFSGIITGITTSAGIGTDLAIKFYVEYGQDAAESDLLSDSQYPILVFDSTVGKGTTSINKHDNVVVGVGTTFVDNIYYAHSVQLNNLKGTITCNIHSKSNLVGIGSTFGSQICGRFSWGRLSSFNRLSSSPLAINLSNYTVNSGLTSYPTIQRRNYGLRNTGAIVKDFD
jgi:hypothetical protein